MKKTYAVSEQTKRALAAALKEKMAHKPLSRLTIGELTEACGMKRQNFYYHFEDIYDLMRWMFREEAVVLLRQHEGALLWQDGLLQLFQYMQENRAVCLCALRSTGRDFLKQFFADDIHSIIHLTIEQVARDIGYAGGGVDLELMTNFYVVALAGLMESWLLGEIDRTPEQLIAFADEMLQTQILGAYIRIHGAPPEEA